VNTTQKKILFCFALMLATSLTLKSRSPHRPVNPFMPSISAQWIGDDKIHVFKSMHLQEYPFFQTYDPTFFNEHLLPNSPIAFRNDPHVSIDGKKLSELIETLLDEVQNKKTKYTHFTILQTKNFNRNSSCGLIVVKCKQFPFVVKLFIETPESFTNPWCKGFEPTVLFYMGGGINRHLSGFTRLRNLETIRQRIAQDSYWSTFVDTPRKWFWLPKKGKELRVVSCNIGTIKYQTIDIPGIFAIVADEIQPDPLNPSTSPKNRSLALNLCDFLNTQIDPHITNFMVEKQTGKFMIIDTEHFPTMVGFREKQTFDGYLSWYAQLTSKYTKNMLFSNKAELRQQQLTPTKPLFLSNI